METIEADSQLLVNQEMHSTLKLVWILWKTDSGSLNTTSTFMVLNSLTGLTISWETLANTFGNTNSTMLSSSTFYTLFTEKFKLTDMPTEFNSLELMINLPITSKLAGTLVLLPLPSFIFERKFNSTLWLEGYSKQRSDFIFKFIKIFK